MLINGSVRQACSALVDQLLESRPDTIELRPLLKFPVVRDLLVDRRRLFRALEKLECWIPVDNYFDMGAGPLQSPEQQERRYPLSQCMSCGCCLEACPQYKKVELQQRSGETDEEFRKRENEVFDRNCSKAANCQAVCPKELPLMSSWGRAGRAATIHVIKNFFQGNA